MKPVAQLTSNPYTPYSKALLSCVQQTVQQAVRERGTDPTTFMLNTHANIFQVMSIVVSVLALSVF